LTAYAREEDRLLCLSRGFAAHLAKPVDPTELTSVVAHLASRRTPRG
jgi:CheY-like chemotaxis protein